MGSRFAPWILIVLCVLSSRAALGQSMLEAQVSTDGPMQDSGFIPATASNSATAQAQYNHSDVSGTISSQGTAEVSEGVTRLYGQAAVMSNPASEVQTSVSAGGYAGDIVNVTGAAGATGNVEVAASIRGSVNGSVGHTALGTDYRADYQISLNVSTNTGQSATLMAEQVTSNLGNQNTGGAPVTVAVGAGGFISLSAAESLHVSVDSNDLRASNTAQVTADYSHTVRWYVIPLSAGLSFTSQSGRDYLPAAGDVNLDGQVGFADLLLLAQNYGQSNATWTQGDLDHDGTVNFADLLILAQHYGQMPGDAQLAQLNPSFAADVRSAFAQVPEPGLGTIIAMASAMLVRRRRR